MEQPTLEVSFLRIVENLTQWKNFLPSALLAQFGGESEAGSEGDPLFPCL